MRDQRNIKNNNNINHYRYVKDCRIIVKPHQRKSIRFKMTYNFTNTSRNISIRIESLQCIVESKRSHVNDVKRNETERTRSQRHERRGKRDK